MPDTSKPPRILVLGAHPDDAEIFGGGLICRQAKLKATIKIVSVTDGEVAIIESFQRNWSPFDARKAAASGALIGANMSPGIFRMVTSKQRYPCVMPSSRRCDVFNGPCPNASTLRLSS